MKHMELTFDNAATATLDGKPSNITLIDAMGGQLGVVRRITIDLEIEAMPKPAVPLVSAAAAKIPGKTAPAPTASGEIKIKKGTKIETLFKALNTPKGITMASLASKLGMSESGAASYLYYYPKDKGCAVEKQDHEGKPSTYHLRVPEGKQLSFS